MNLNEVATIERIIRQGWCEECESQYEEWLGVDKDQALALIAMIPGRAMVQPKPFPFTKASNCPNCEPAALGTHDSGCRALVEF